MINRCGVKYEIKQKLNDTISSGFIRLVIPKIIFSKDMESSEYMPLPDTLVTYSHNDEEASWVVQGPAEPSS
jgi:hypothetical protein